MVGEGRPSTSAQWDARKPWMAGPSPAMTFVAPVSHSFRRLISVKPYGLRHARHRLSILTRFVVLFDPPAPRSSLSAKAGHPRLRSGTQGSRGWRDQAPP